MRRPNTNWLNTIREGGRVKRSHTLPTVRHYDVAQHTFGAIAIALELLRMNNHGGIDDSNCIAYLMAHDLAEQYTGDTPASAKAVIPGLRDILHKAEEEWLRQVLPDYLLPELTSEEKLLCKSADLLEFAYHCVDEREMGNKTERNAEAFNNAIEYLHETGAFATTRGVPGIVDELMRRWRRV